MRPLPSHISRTRRMPMADINVTPMVDVMLVLLIIFMVTAPLLTAGVPVNLPDARAKPLAQDKEPVQVNLDADGRIFLGDREVQAGAFSGELAKLVTREPRQVFLRADRTLDYGQVMRVMGMLNAAGFSRIALVATGSAAP
jgi:biopolymer transport protein TolR